MHVLRCDKCGEEISMDSKTALRVYAMGKRGLMVLPLEDVVKPAKDDRHFCGGACLIAFYGWLATQ